MVAADRASAAALTALAVASAATDAVSCAASFAAAASASARDRDLVGRGRPLSVAPWPLALPPPPPPAFGLTAELAFLVTTGDLKRFAEKVRRGDDKAAFCNEDPDAGRRGDAGPEGSESSEALFTAWHCAHRVRGR